MNVGSFAPPSSGRASRQQPGDGRPPRRRRPLRWLALAAGTLLMATAGAGIGLHFAHRGSAAAGSGATRGRVNLYQVPVRPAPGFTLTDQDGRTISLKSLRGKAVALYFMDPRCQNVCPIVAREFITANRALGAAAAHVEMVGIDVNPNYLGRHWLRAFDAEHGLSKLPNWHFLTGTLPQLRRVWQSYGISVQVNPKTKEISHTTVIDFVGPGGRLRAMAGPYSRVRNGKAYLPAGLLGRWGSGIAGQLRRLLPDHSGR